MVKIRFLGACQEVGRSGVLFESEESGECILCDYGTKMDEHEQLFPLHVGGKDLMAIVVTHAHIDHTGGLPLFYISGSVPLYLTKLTYKVTEILLSDMLNITDAYLPFERREIKRMGRYSTFLDYGVRRRVGKKSYITLFDAGHIPGSAMVLVEMDGKRILYTGDVNAVPTRLLNGLDLSQIGPIDAIVMETTYGTTDHPDRRTIENEFVSKVKEIVSNGGVVLIPAFGVSRSQEILMVLYKDGPLDFPVTVDGMARQIAHLYEEFPEMLRDPDELRRAMSLSHFIAQKRRESERSIAGSEPGAIIAPSGMLKGGTSRMYAERILHDSKNAIILVSYQIEDTPGRILMDRLEYITDDNPSSGIPVSAQVYHFDFSSHSGKSELINMLEELEFRDKENKRVFCVHGDKEVMLSFASEIRKRGYNVETPVEGQTFSI